MRVKVYIIARSSFTSAGRLTLNRLPRMFALLALISLALSRIVLGDVAEVKPQKINLTSRTAPVGGSLKRRALGASSVPLADFFLGTDLQ